MDGLDKHPLAGPSETEPALLLSSGKMGHKTEADVPDSRTAPPHCTKLEGRSDASAANAASTGKCLPLESRLVEGSILCEIYKEIKQIRILAAQN